MVETAEQYKEDKDALMMKDVDELPKLLVGKLCLPREAKTHPGQITEPLGPKPASDAEFEMILKKKPMSNKAVEKSSPPAIEQLVVEKPKKLYKIYDKQPYVSAVTPGSVPKPMSFHRENHGSPFRYITPRVQAPPRGYWDPYSPHTTTSAAPYYSNPWQPAHQPVFVYDGPQPGYGMPIYGYSREEERKTVTQSKPELILIDDEKPVIGSLMNSRAGPSNRHN